MEFAFFSNFERKGAIFQQMQENIDGNLNHSDH
jgi:hypothetical protein